MKHYLIGIFQPEGGTPPDNLDEITRDLNALNDEMRAAGVWVFSGGLHAPDSATVVRADAHDALITDGPFLEGKEYLAGISIIRAADLDEALSWARRMRAIIGLPIEVRPFVGESPGS